MSTEVRKRGRPRKVVAAVEESVAETVAPEKTPKKRTPNAGDRAKAVGKRAAKASEATAIESPTTPVIGAEELRTGKRKETVKKLTPTPRKNAAAATAAATESPSSLLEPPPAIIAAIARHESKILRAVAEAQHTLDPNLISPSAPPPPKPVLPTSPAAVLPLLAPQPASHLQPPTTLAMGLPIPTHQSTALYSGHYPTHILPWLPNPHTLHQTAYLSTQTSARLSKLRVPSLREMNKMAVDEFAARGGPGSGAGVSRAKVQSGVPPGVGTNRPTVMEEGRMPDKYRPAARRVGMIIVALPVVIVTSYMLYQRLVLGVEPKKRPRVPS